MLGRKWQRVVFSLLDDRSKSREELRICLRLFPGRRTSRPNWHPCRTGGSKRTVSVGEEKASVVEERKVGWQKCVSAPAWSALSLKPHCIGSILALSVDPAVHRGIFFPNRFPLERELGESLHALVCAKREKFLVSFLAHFQPVATSLKLLAKGPDEFAIWIEYENGRVVGLVATAFVNDIKVARLVHGNVMGGLPSELVRELGPVMMDFIAVFAFTDDEWPGLALLGR